MIEMLGQIVGHEGAFGSGKAAQQSFELFHEGPCFGAGRRSERRGRRYSESGGAVLSAEIVEHIGGVCDPLRRHSQVQPRRRRHRRRVSRPHWLLS